MGINKMDGLTIHDEDINAEKIPDSETMIPDWQLKRIEGYMVLVLRKRQLFSSWIFARLAKLLNTLWYSYKRKLAEMCLAVLKDNTHWE